MTRTHWLLLIIAFVLFVIWRFFAAKIMLQCAARKGFAYGKELNYFMMCFLFGLPGYFYVASLPDLRVQRYLQRIVWLLDPNDPEKRCHENPPTEFPKWQAETPKKDGRAEAHLDKIGKTAEEYKCERLIVVKKVRSDKCFMCNRNQKEIKTCRMIKNDANNNVPICADCINVFIEYNPESVFDLDSLGTKKQQSGC